MKAGFQRDVVENPQLEKSIAGSHSATCHGWAGELLAGLLLLSMVGCDRGGPHPERAARTVIAGLRAIPDDKQRAAVSALTFNTMCTISRIAEGKADGNIETRVASLLTGRAQGIKDQLKSYRKTLGFIPGSVRGELLGSLSSVDPGACDAAPNWEHIRNGIIFSHQLVPHLRANFCANGFTYADGTSGVRAITVNSLLTAIVPPIEGNGLPTHFLSSFATPALIGIETSEFVAARHPSLAASAQSGEGVSLYGFNTNIPCSQPSHCDASLGQMCMGGNCTAFPVVQKDQLIVLRGYNFWDVAEARVIFQPVEAGQGSESSATIEALDPNEPTGPVACQLPSLANASYNRAHFRVPANEGHFYRLRMFNHNGQFLTQADGRDHGPPRVIHTCFPPGGPNPDNVPPGTNRACTLTQETCAADGANCSVGWTSPPRKLEDCRHLPGQPVVCGETPEWYEAQMLSPRADGIAQTPDAIVFVEADAPMYKLTGTLHALQSREETGPDWPGSDEPLVAIVGANLSQNAEVPSVEDLSVHYLGEDFDEGDRDIVDKQLISVELPVDGTAAFLAIAQEDDGFAEAFAAGLLAIAIVAAIVVLLNGALVFAALGGAAGVTLVWGFLVNQFHAGDDDIGREAFSATPLEVRERIGASHSPSFLTTQPPLFGPLPRLENGGTVDARAGSLIHPFEDFRAGSGPLQPECNPGTCSSQGMCLVNRCVPNDFVDPSAAIGFRERREFTGNGGYWVLDFDWRLQQQ